MPTSRGAVSRGSLRVGIERDDVADAAWHVRRPTVDGHERRIGGAAEKPVELVQLAPLALPPHPFLFARVEDAAAVQQKKAIAVGAGPVPMVQAFDRLGGNGEQMGVAFSSAPGRRRRHPSEARR